MKLAYCKSNDSALDFWITSQGRKSLQMQSRVYLTRNESNFKKYTYSYKLLFLYISGKTLYFILFSVSNPEKEKYIHNTLEMRKQKRQRDPKKKKNRCIQHSVMDTTTKN